MAHIQPHIQLLKRLHDAFNQCSFKSMCLKPKQIRCWEGLVHGTDVIGVLPTGFGKSLVFQLLPFVLPPRCPGTNNIVLVVCPLNAIIDDQILQLKRIGIECGVLRARDKAQISDDELYKLFKGNRIDNKTLDDGLLVDNPVAENADDETNEKVAEDLLEPKKPIVDERVSRGEYSIIFAHPEAYLSVPGRQLLNSDVYQKRVVAIAIDEAHCVETWYVYSFLCSVGANSQGISCS